MPIERLSAVASGQLGLFTRSDARRQNVSGDQLRRLAHRGIVERVTPQVFRFTASARSWHQDVLAACLDGGTECVASHRTAAVVHEFDGFEPGVIEVLVPMHVRHRRKNVIVHHTRSARDRPDPCRAHSCDDEGSDADRPRRGRGGDPGVPPMTLMAEPGA